LTTELIQEGVARDIVRNVQNLRKAAEYNIEDRIRVGVQTGDEGIRAAVAAFKDYICAETLADELTAAPLTGKAVQSEEAKIGSATVTLQVTRGLRP
jgi:isoleucyl-tRNA synthetase